MTITNKTAYKFRVECGPDYTRIKRVIGDRMVENKYECDGFGDIEVTIESTLSLDQLRQLISSVPDAHVAVQTIMPVAEYTGDRNYDL